MRLNEGMTTPLIYDLGQIPPSGVVPKKMWAATIRQSRYGRPVDAYQLEQVDVPPVGPRQVLVLVMAAGINYNGIWAALGKPVDVIGLRQHRGATEDFHIAGSDASGVVWRVGEEVQDVKVGDSVVITPSQFDTNAPDIRRGGDPLLSRSVQAWGYETNYGSFAQFTRVDDYQLLPKPSRLSWEEAACYMLSGGTAYRQLMSWAPNTVKPGDPVLIWGGGGSLGSMAIQITRHFGGRPIAVVSSESKFEHCRGLGATGVIDRSRFDHWGPLPAQEDMKSSLQWMKGVRDFGKAFWEALGERRNPAIVFEHSGRDTLPSSIFMCEPGGMVVACGGTSGYIGDVDLRFLWMRQKRFQGSHGASLKEYAELNRLIDSGAIHPCLAHLGSLETVGKIHQQMYENIHPTGNLAILVNAPTSGQNELS
jgi:crotonyl-CoA carboxylase/reductase